MAWHAIIFCSSACRSRPPYAYLAVMSMSTATQLLLLTSVITLVCAFVTVPHSRIINDASYSLTTSRYQLPPTSWRLASTPSDTDGEPSFVDSIVTNVQKSVKIAQDSSASGSSFKQIVADVLAGDYDEAAVSAKLDELIASAPCVVFIWEASPFSKKAIAALEMMGADFKVVRLDDPWSEGNPLRAEIGKRVGRPTVPSIWIGGEYVGGFDGGTGEDSPGIVDLAFRGTLRPMLEAAGALKKE